MAAKQAEVSIIKYGMNLMDAYGGFFGLIVVLAAVFCIALGK